MTPDDTRSSPGVGPRERPIARPGVLLAQVGTPAAPTPKAVRRFLRAFLSDRRIVDLPRWKWWPILHGIVLRVRPARVARLYQRIWTERGSPLLFHTQDLAVRSEQDGLGLFAVGMRCSEPSIEQGLEELLARGAGSLTVLPLFPQFSRTTSASVADAVLQWSRRTGHEVEVLRDFPDDPVYVEALAESVRAAGVVPSAAAPLLISFHGIPVRYAELGDPYPKRCDLTAKALVTSLGLGEGSWRVVYQSRFGREPWLAPSLDETLRALPAQGIQEVSVITPSFFADCLETLDEIGREARHTFLSAGGERFTTVPCLNATPGAVRTIHNLLT